MKKYLVLGLLLLNAETCVVAMERDDSRLLVPASSLTGEPDHLALDIKPLMGARRLSEGDLEKQLRNIKKVRRDGEPVSLLEMEEGRGRVEELTKSSFERLMENQTKALEASNDIAREGNKTQEDIRQQFTRFAQAGGGIAGAGLVAFIFSMARIIANMPEDCVNN